MSVVPIDFQDGVNDFDIGVNESIFFSFVCRMTQMNAQKCNWMLIKMQKSLLNLGANVRFFALMNASPRCWSPFHTNECVFSRNEQQKVYYKGNKWRCKESTIRGHRKSRLGLRFFPCPLMVDSLHLPLFPL